MLWLSGCGSGAQGSSGQPSGEGGGAGQAIASSEGGNLASLGGSSAAGTPVIEFAGGSAATDSGEPGGACAVESASASLEPVFLVFAFDVSGSMGKGDEPWHDRTLKWDPVVAATKAFFEDPASAGISASMTFFPAAGGEDTRCLDESYRVPDVPMTALPSTDFGVALDVIGSESWRGGTPTLHVVRGVSTYLDELRQDHPGNYAVVLVTDGYPQDCSDNSIDSVVQAVSAIAPTTPTYVIGVANPPIDGAPDTVGDLGAIAVAGNTGDAFILDTGDPTQTTAAFLAKLQGIRGERVSCTIDIPPPPAGRQFDRQKVAVTYLSSDVSTELVYDAACSVPNAWHYDDPDAPTSIVLCPDTCPTIQADPNAQLGVAFTCEQVITVLK